MNDQNFNQLSPSEKLAAIRARRAARNNIPQPEPKPSTDQNLTVYTVRIAMHKQYDDKFGWYIDRRSNELPRFQRDLANTVIVQNGEVFVSLEVLSFFGDTRGSDLMPALKFGRRSFYRLSHSAVVELINWDLAYPRRTSNQRDVLKRNIEIANWLRSL